MEINLYSATTAMEITNDNSDACEKILALLIAEIPKFITQLDTANKQHDIYQLREIIHGMIGAFHYTGANTIKGMLKQIQKSCKVNPSDTEKSIQKLINELRALENYLNNNTIKF